MPEISRFYGIIIRMFYNDHNPPHFHVVYQESEAVIDINTLDIIAGELPGRALSLAIEWAVSHRKELIENWEKAQNHETLKKIKPLD